MYTMKKGLKNKKLGAVLGWLFALFAVIASFGIGNMTQGNSIATSVHATFGVSVTVVGVVITVDVYKRQQYSFRRWCIPE